MCYKGFIDSGKNVNICFSYRRSLFRTIDWLLILWSLFMELI